MKRIRSISLLAILCLFFVSMQVDAQYMSTKIKSKYQIYTDSLKHVEYNYLFPIWGQGAYKKGFDIPYPAGIMGNYMWMKQGILIDNLQLGLTTNTQDVPLTGVDFISFGENTNTSYTVNVRPDLWIFPFLNVYGIFGYGNSSTEVNIVAPIELSTVVDQNVSTAGVGLLSAFGIGPVWMSVDFNMTWNKPELLDKAVNANVLGLRLGHTFVFEHKPYRNLAIWAGAMRMHMGSATAGEIQLKDALPAQTWEQRDELVDNYWTWYDNEATLAQKLTADKILTPIVDRIESADGSSVVKYGMDKQVKNMWNGIVGMQFQLNKRWMFRGEGGVIGDRKSFLISVNYRFLV